MREARSVNDITRFSLDREAGSCRSMAWKSRMRIDVRFNQLTTVRLRFHRQPVSAAVCLQVSFHSRFQSLLTAHEVPISTAHKSARCHKLTYLYRMLVGPLLTSPRTVASFGGTVMRWLGDPTMHLE